MDLPFKEEVYRIIGAAMEVHTAQGPGFLEPVYQECMELELAECGIPFQAQAPLRIKYKEHVLKKEYAADLLCFDAVIVELKALPKLTSNEEAQLLNYLKASGLKVGLLINFGSSGPLEWKRMVY